jgi:hypothetical protein
MSPIDGGECHRPAIGWTHRLELALASGRQVRRAVGDGCTATGFSLVTPTRGTA